MVFTVDIMFFLANITSQLVACTAHHLHAVCMPNTVPYSPHGSGPGPKQGTLARHNNALNQYIPFDIKPQQLQKQRAQIHSLTYRLSCCNNTNAFKDSDRDVHGIITSLYIKDGREVRPMFSELGISVTTDSSAIGCTLH